MLTFVLVSLMVAPAVVFKTVETVAAEPGGDIWKPAVTPGGGVSWAVLDATGETTRNDAMGYILSKPQFTP